MRKLIIIFGMLISIMFSLYAPVQAYDFFGQACKNNPTANTGPNAGEASPVCTDNKKQGTVNPVVNIIRITTSVFALLAGILAVIMIIVSGLTLVTSNGNADAVANSRKRIVNALIGVALVALAWTIIRFVTDRIIQ
jgi:hypothetical protein